MRIVTFTTAGILALSLASCSTPTQQGSVSTEQSSSFESMQEIETNANAGDRSAQFVLGALYQEGDGVTRDLNKAREWFRKSADQGDARAQFNLGVMYYNGESVSKNLREAATWFAKAADQGNARGEFNLGVMYYRGEDLPVSLERAKELFEKAAMQGVPEAQFNLAVMYAKGETVPVDPVEAYAWFSLAKANGDTKVGPILDDAKPKLTAAQLSAAQKRITELNSKVTKAE